MSELLTPLATAAAAILATQQQQAEAERLTHDSQAVEHNKLTLAHFWLRYPALVELLQTSGIVVTTETSDDEDGWSKLVFTSPDFQPLRLLVTNYAPDERLISNFAISGRPVEYDELVVWLGKHFAADKAGAEPTTAPQAEEIAGRSAGYYLGKAPAFPQRVKKEGQPQGLSKLEYLAATNLQTLIAQSDGSAHHAELATQAVQLAQTLLTSLAEAK